MGKHSRPKNLTKQCCCGTPSVHRDLENQCGNCFVGAHSVCEQPVWVDDQNNIKGRV